MLFSFDDLLVTTPGASPPPTNRPPTATVVFSPAKPTTDQTLTATVTASDPDGDGQPRVRLEGQRHRQAHEGHTAKTDTFNLSLAGNGDPGQVVSVEVTPRDAATHSTAP